MIHYTFSDFVDQLHFKAKLLLVEAETVSDQFKFEEQLFSIEIAVISRTLFLADHFRQIWVVRRSN